MKGHYSCILVTDRERGGVTRCGASDLFRHVTPKGFRVQHTEHARGMLSLLKQEKELAHLRYAGHAEHTRCMLSKLSSGSFSSHFYSLRQRFRQSV